MAATVQALRWLDRLEQEFDKSFTDLDIVLGQFEDEDEYMEQAREKMGVLSSVFAQLCHKAQTIFQNNAKLEAQLVDMRTELCQLNAERPCLDGTAATAAVHATANEPERVVCSDARAETRLPGQLAVPSMLLYNAQLAIQFEKENQELRQYILALQGEVYGARLAAKYLDKELAGRIQQIQLMGRNMNAAQKEKLWNQLEAEIYLHRHKTVIRACQGRKVVDSGTSPAVSINQESSRKRRGLHPSRTVSLHRDASSSLGLSVTGGSEHGVPILISDVRPDSIAAKSGQLFVGDAILSVNGMSLSQARHSDAVDLLSKQCGELQLELAYMEPDSDSEDEDGMVENDAGFRYRVYDPSITKKANASGVPDNSQQQDIASVVMATVSSSSRCLPNESPTEADSNKQKASEQLSPPPSATLTLDTSSIPYNGCSSVDACTAMLNNSSAKSDVVIVTSNANNTADTHGIDIVAASTLPTAGIESASAPPHTTTGGIRGSTLNVGSLVLTSIQQTAGPVTNRGGSIHGNVSFVPLSDAADNGIFNCE